MLSSTVIATATAFATTGIRSLVIEQLRALSCSIEEEKEKEVWKDVERKWAWETRAFGFGT